MVSTKNNTKGGGPREKGAQQKTQNVKSPTIPVTSEPPAGKKATAEQIRMANMIYSDSTEMDNDKIKEKVQQIKELTNRTEDEILVVLYDANYDTEQAINMLLERDETESKPIDGWVTTSSKKSKLRSHQGGGSSKGQQDALDVDIGARGNKSDRDRGKGGRDRDKNDAESKDRGQDNDRRRDRDGGFRGKGRGGRGPLPPRMARGKGREYDGGSRDRYRGDRDFGRGRGRKNGEMNGPSRSRGGRAFTNSTFNDKPVENDAFNSGDNVWRNPPEENWDDVDSSSAPKEDWGAEEWTGDLTHTQVFTASNTEEASANSIDAVPQTTAPSLATSTTPYGGQSQEPSASSFSSSEPYQSNSIYSQNSTSVSQQNTGMPEMSRSIDLAELFRNSTQHSVPQSTLPVTSNKDDSSIFSQFQNYQPPSSIPSGEPPKPSSQLSDTSSQVNRAPQLPTSQTSQQPRTQPQAKPTRKKLPQNTSKFPPSAVEMPLSARGLGPLDVQFGAMDINMDPAITDYGIPLPGTSLSSKGDLSSGAFSVDDAKSSTSHLSSYNAKVTDSAYSAGLGSTRMSSNSIPSTVPPSSMDQSVRSAYGHSQTVSSQKLAPDPIPLPTQSELKSSSYMGGQKVTTSGSIEGSVDTTLPTSVGGISTSVLPPSSGFGLSGNQSLSTSRQAGSYGTPSSAVTVTVSSSISGYGTSALSSGGLGAGLSSTGSSSLGGSGSMGVSSSIGGATSTIGGSSSLVGSNSMGGGTTSIGPTSVINGAGTNSIGGYSSPNIPSSNLSPLPSNSSSYSVSSANVSQSTHTSVQTSPLSNSKMGSMDSRTSSQHGLETSIGASSGLSSGSSSVHGSSSTTSTPSISASATTLPSVVTSSTTLGYPSTTIAGSTLSTSMTASGSGSISSSGIKPTNKVPPNLPPGMPFVNHHLIMGGHGLLPVNAFTHQFYNYEDIMLQRMQQPMGYPYDLQQFQQLATTLNTGRDASSLSNAAQYSVTEPSKFPRNDAASPVASSLSSQQPQAGGHHQTQAQTQTPFLNPTLPPGYPAAAAGYGGLPYGGLAYPGASIIPPGLSYPVFPAVSTVQPPSRTQAGSTPHSGYQQSAFAQPASYGTNTAMKRVSGYQPFGHPGPGPQPNPPGAFGTLQGYEEPADFTKGFSSQSQSKGSAATARGSVSVSSASDVGGSYGSKSHSQSFADKQSAFHNQTPPPFNFPMATATQGGHAGATYPTPFVPLFPAGHHSAMPLHQIPGDTTGAGSSQRSQGSSGQNKGPSGKPSYGAYWGN